eukprot:1138300-Pelagomonas_calceolata.AAC.6
MGWESFEGSQLMNSSVCCEQSRIITEPDQPVPAAATTAAAAAGLSLAGGRGGKKVLEALQLLHKVGFEMFERDVDLLLTSLEIQPNN